MSKKYLEAKRKAKWAAERNVWRHHAVNTGMVRKLICLRLQKRSSKLIRILLVNYYDGM